MFEPEPMSFELVLQNNLKDLHTYRKRRLKGIVFCALATYKF